MVRHDSQEILNCLTEEVCSPPIDINDEIQRILWIYLTVRSTQGSIQEENYVCVVEDYAKILRYGFELNKYYQSNSNRPSGYTLSESTRKILKTENAIAEGISSIKTMFENVFDIFVPKYKSESPSNEKSESPSHEENTPPAEMNESDIPLSSTEEGAPNSTEESAPNSTEEGAPNSTEESAPNSTEESRSLSEDPSFLAEGGTSASSSEPVPVEKTANHFTEKKTDLDDVLVVVGEIFGKATKVASYFDKLKNIVDVFNTK